MNEITNETTTTPEHLGMVEILDANGNPTGEYRPAGEGETPQAEAQIVAEDHADHVM